MRLVTVVGAICLAFTSSVFAEQSSRETTYSVSITNISKGVQFTPLLNVTHSRNVSLFEVGEVASQGLADIAEGGATEGLAAEVMSADQSAMTVATQGLLNPGQTAELEIVGDRSQRFSMAAMLLPTNDAFVALNAVELPQRRRSSVTYYATVYDAGSETNDEYCVNIPGPRCGGAPFSPEDKGEGYVYPSPGIHGEGDLSQSTYDWHGPVAKVVITRMG